MNEIIVNLHMHTRYSDGTGSHSDIVDAALAAGIDVVIVTDHNVWVKGPEKYYQNGNNKILMLVGEEIHDRTRDPQKNHLLVIGADRELSASAKNPQILLDRVREAGGLSFIAHPNDPPAPAIGEPGLSWENWDIHGFHGIELWNSMTEFKSHLKSRFHAIYYAFSSKDVGVKPFPETLKLWDSMLSQGKQIVAIGGSDAHAFPGRLGFLKKTIFPYKFHFQCINTHLLLPEPLVGNLETDKHLIINAFRQGHAFIGYDLPASTTGFRFTAQGKDIQAMMGDQIDNQFGVTLQVRLPRRALCNLIKDGEIIKTWRNRDTCTYITSEPGVYRIEVYLNYRGRQRGWIYSNPIYVR